MLSPTITAQYADYRHHVDQIVASSIAAADPGAAVSNHLNRNGQILTIGQEPNEERIDLSRRRVFMIAVGKAALPMARATARILGDNLTKGIILVKDRGTPLPSEFDPAKIAILQGSHPVPEARNIAATKTVLDMVGGLEPDDIVLCLISGGTSALLTWPMLPLDDLRQLVHLLLNSGCTINELNAVRRAVDRIKSGGLARAISPATTYGLILSDVIGNPLNIIGSGPTVLEDDLLVSAVQVLGRYDIARQLEREQWGRLALALNQTRHLHKSQRASARNIIVGDVRNAATAALVAAIQQGFIGQLLTVHLDGQARELGRLAGGIARDLAPGHCLVMGGETTVTVRGGGRGGRNQEFALSAAIALAQHPKAVVMSFATDGEDGPTPAAGAAITGETYRLARSYGLNPINRLIDNDSHNFFSRLDSMCYGRAEPHLITTGPTDTNVNDLVVILSYGE